MNSSNAFVWYHSHKLLSLSMLMIVTGCRLHSSTAYAVAGAATELKGA